MAEITWLGYECFRIRAREATIITDPYASGLGYQLPKGLLADIVTVSNPDDTYLNNTAAIKRKEGEARVIDGVGEYEVSTVFINGIASQRDKKKGQERGKNTIYTMTVEDINICHLGDLGHALTAAQNEAIGDVDILFIPIGGNGGMDAAMASEVIGQLEPRIVIPMRYRTGENQPAPDVKLDTVERFAKELGLKDPVALEKLSIKKADLPENTQVILLEAK